MLKQSCFSALIGFSLCWGGSAMAQQSDGSEIFYEYARNKIGLLRYCRDQALLGQVTADRAIKAIDNGLQRLPISERLVRERGDRAEKAGEQGFWEANGKHDIASIAELRRTTLIDLCKELGGQTRTTYPAAVVSEIGPKIVTPDALKAKTSDVVMVKAPDAIKVTTLDLVKVKTPDAALIIDLPPQSSKPADPPIASAKAADPAPWGFSTCN